MKAKFSHMTQLLMNIQQIFLGYWEATIKVFVPKINGLY